MKYKLDARPDAIATRSDISNSEIKIADRISETRADMIKWLFIFWIGQVAATFGFILLFLKK